MTTRAQSPQGACLGHSYQSGHSEPVLTRDAESVMGDRWGMWYRPAVFPVKTMKAGAVVYLTSFLFWDLPSPPKRQQTMLPGCILIWVYVHKDAIMDADSPPRSPFRKSLWQPEALLVTVFICLSALQVSHVVWPNIWSRKTVLTVIKGNGPDKILQLFFSCVADNSRTLSELQYQALGVICITWGL